MLQEQYPHNKVRQMRGARGIAYAINGGIDAAIADAAIATFGIDDDDDDDDTAPIDSQPHEPTMPPRKSTRGNPPPPLTQDTMNRMIQESVKAAIRAERERVQNEANHAEGPNVALVARECTFADFMKCSPITFSRNEGAVDLIRWIEKTEMVFTVATLGIEVVTQKMWAEMKVMMTEEFRLPEEIQRMEGGLWNLRNERRLRLIYRLSENIKGEVTSSKPATLNKAVRMAHTLMEQKVKAIAEEKLIIRRGSGKTSKEAVVVVVEITIVTGTTTTTTAT
nr:hypothetical protein [Tanacetum cinerariifolium]